MTLDSNWIGCTSYNFTDLFFRDGFYLDRYYLNPTLPVPTPRLTFLILWLLDKNGCEQSNAAHFKKAA